MDIYIDRARYILTVDAHDRVIEHGSIAIDGGRILAVGPAAEVEARYRKDLFRTVIDARSYLACPGLVDAHLHVTEHLSRGLIPDNLRTVEWVYDWGKPWYSAMEDDDEYIGTLLACVDMIKTGTTCFLDQGVYNPGVRSGEAMERSGIRGIVGRHAADKPPKHIPAHWKPHWITKQYSTTDEALSELERVIRLWHGKANGRIRAWANLEGKIQHTTDALYLGAKALADRYGVGTEYHLASSIEEARVVEAESGRWPVGHAYDIGALGRNVVLAHCVAVREEEVALLAETQTSVAFCPGTSLKLAKGSSRIGLHDHMLEAGVTVALGCDGVCAWGSSSMLEQIKMAVGIYKDARMDPARMSAVQALWMGTINGARALLWEDEIGSLESEKRADLVLFDMDRPDWVPCHDPVQTLVFSASGDSATTVIIDGRIVMRDRVIQTLDEAEVLEQARQAAERVAQASGLLERRR